MDTKHKTRLSIESGADGYSVVEVSDAEELNTDLVVPTIRDLCGRLSKSNRNTILALVEALIDRESEAKSKVLLLEKELEKQKKSNLGLARRVSKLEKNTVPRDPKKETYAEQAAKRPVKTAPKTIKELAASVRPRAEYPSAKVVLIKPPKGEKDPLNFLARAYNPSSDGIRVLSMRETRNKEHVVVRLASEVGAVALKEAPALKGCAFSNVERRLPKIIIYGTTHEHGTYLREDILLQNTSISEHYKGRYNYFEDDFQPLRFWRGKRKDEKVWLVEVTPKLRQLLVGRLRGRIHWRWSCVRVVDYVGATRCFKCQSYGHIAKYCKAAKGTCGHCAGAGHLYTECTASQSPPQCAPCQRKGSPSDHSVRNKTCPSFIEAARREMSRTDY